MSKRAKVVIVGRANVGKSMLFNRLSNHVKSLTFDYEGVTRDFVSEEITWNHCTFELVDTGGIKTQSSINEIETIVSERAHAQLKQADVVLFVCDASVGLFPADREIARLLYSSGKAVILVLNKSDRNAAQDNQYEFSRLGFKNQVLISAAHGTGIEDLMELVTNILSVAPVDKEINPRPEFSVIILGKPNVGKSSLMNLLVKEERSIVANQPGTTREALVEKIRFNSQDVLIADTPGIRRKRAIDEPLEKLMVKSAFSALTSADVVLLMIDAAQGQLSDQELKLAFYAFERGKALILLFNKQDLVTEETEIELDSDIEYYKHLMDKVEQLSISCATEKNIGKILPLVQKVWQRNIQQFSPEQLTTLFKEALMQRPLVRNEQHLLVHYAKQIRTAPITIALKVNYPLWFEKTQLAYLEKIMRMHFDLKSVSIKFVVSKK